MQLDCELPKMLSMNFTEKEYLPELVDQLIQVLLDTSLLLCTEFEQVGSITAETAEQCIYSFSATFLDLQYLEWHFILIFQVNTLFKVKFLKSIYRRYIPREDKFNYF